MRTLPPVGRPNGGRLGNRKETTGCRTCKKRKIKCDETKPFCNRCTSTKRECGGYATPLERDTTTIGVLTEISRCNSSLPLDQAVLRTTITETSREADIFEYFVHQRAQTVAGFISTELWSRLVPQLCHTVPAVRHAVLSLGSLLMHADDLQSAERRKTSLALARERMVFAVCHYQKAIQSTVQALRAGKGNALLATLTCVLFFYIEAVQGREKQALELYGRGRNVGDSLVARSRDVDALTSDLAETFSRLAVQRAMMDQRTVYAVEVPESSQPILSLAQAHKELINLLTCGIELCKENEFAKWSTAKESLAPTQSFLGLEARTQSAVRAFDDWAARFAVYRQHNSREFQDRRTEIVTLLLHSWRSAVQIWLGEQPSRAEMVYDKYLPDFQVMLAGIRTALDSAHEGGQTLAFTAEVGILATLWTIILRCRDRTLRRQALALARKAPAQEGLWRRDVAIQAWEKLVALEEGTATLTTDVTAEDRNMIIPENARCKIIEVGPGFTDEAGRWVNTVDYYLKPNGLDGPWEIRREEVII